MYGKEIKLEYVEKQTLPNYINRYPSQQNKQKKNTYIIKVIIATLK